MRFLSYILDILFPPRDRERLVREATPASVAALVKEQALIRDGYTVTSLLPYRYPLVRALIIQTKFADDRVAAALLAHVLHAHLMQQHLERLVVIPIPLSRTRLRERGYNQVERVAKLALADMEGATLAPALLSRIRDTRPQTELIGSARSRNVQNAFSARVLDPEVHYLIIDDVVTTGSTMQEAVHTLREAGAAHIEALALAH